MFPAALTGLAPSTRYFYQVATERVTDLFLVFADNQWIKAFSEKRNGQIHLRVPPIFRLSFRETTHVKNNPKDAMRDKKNTDETHTLKTQLELPLSGFVLFQLRCKSEDPAWIKRGLFDFW